MMRIATVLVATGALLLGATPAAADQPTTTVEQISEEIRCGEVVGIATGELVQRWHVHENRDGSVSFTFSEHGHGEFVETSTGRSWRLVGAGSGAGQFEPEFRIDRKSLHIEIVDRGGRLGRLTGRYTGREWVFGGECEFV